MSDGCEMPPPRLIIDSAPSAVLDRCDFASWFRALPNAVMSSFDKWNLRSVATFPRNDHRRFLVPLFDSATSKLKPENLLEMRAQCTVGSARPIVHRCTCDIFITSQESGVDGINRFVITFDGDPTDFGITRLTHFPLTELQTETSSPFTHFNCKVGASFFSPPYAEVTKLSATPTINQFLFSLFFHGKPKYCGRLILANKIVKSS